MFTSKSIVNMLLSHTSSTDNYFAASRGISLVWDPQEETTPLREMMKLEVTANCFIKADLKLTPKKEVVHGSRRQLVQGCDNCLYAVTLSSGWVLL